MVLIDIGKRGVYKDDLTDFRLFVSSGRLRGVSISEAPNGETQAAVLSTAQHRIMCRAMSQNFLLIQLDKFDLTANIHLHLGQFTYS